MTSFSMRTFFGQRALTNVGEKRTELRLYVGLLLAGDALFTLLHLAQGLARHFGFNTPILADPKLALTFSGGYGEVFIFAQLFVLTGILARIGIWTKQPIFLLWAVIYFYVLLDDSFNIHGYLGGLLAPSLPTSGMVGLSQQHAGELLSWLAIGCAALAGLKQANSHSGTEYKEISRPLYWTFGLLVFFAVGVDTLQQISVGVSPLINSLVAMIEEGGEMIAVTLTIGAAIVLSRKAALAVKPETD